MVQPSCFCTLACKHSYLHAPAAARRSFRRHVHHFGFCKCNESNPRFRYFHCGIAKPRLGCQERKGRRILHAHRFNPIGYERHDEPLATSLWFFLGLEMASVPMACVVAFDAYRNNSAEAAAKFILTATFSSGVMLYGISFIYGASVPCTLAILLQICKRHLSL